MMLTQVLLKMGEKIIKNMMKIVEEENIFKAKENILFQTQKFILLYII